MQTILLPIQKKYCEKIFSGQKFYEFRKSVPSKNIEKIIVYESRGCGMAIGELLIKGIISGSIEEIWQLTKNKAGIEYSEFIKYFKSCEVAFVYSILSYVKYNKPKSIDQYNLSRAPQNFVWIERK